MILRLALFALAFCSSLSAPLFAGGERGNNLLSEIGGTPGVAGAAGAPGAAGLPGIPGIPGGSATVLGGADFYALMPTDNPGSVGGQIVGGDPVAFPNSGSSFGGSITSIPAGTDFTFVQTGTYVILFQVSVTEPGQLMLTLNTIPLPETVVGRATGATQIVGMSYVTALAGDVLQVINPPGQTGITITPKAGQALSLNPVSAHLVILRIK